MLPRVHKHIAGGHQWLSWALGRERALRSTGVLYGEHKYTMPDGTLVRVHMMGEDSHVWLTPFGDGSSSSGGWIAYPAKIMPALLESVAYATIPVENRPVVEKIPFVPTPRVPLPVLITPPQPPWPADPPNGVGPVWSAQYFPFGSGLGYNGGQWTNFVPGGPIKDEFGNTVGYYPGSDVPIVPQPEEWSEPSRTMFLGSARARLIKAGIPLTWPPINVAWIQPSGQTDPRIQATEDALYDYSVLMHAHAAGVLSAQQSYGTALAAVQAENASIDMQNQAAYQSWLGETDAPMVAKKNIECDAWDAPKRPGRKAFLETLFTRVLAEVEAGFTTKWLTRAVLSPEYTPVGPFRQEYFIRVTSRTQEIDPNTEARGPEVVTYAISGPDGQERLVTGTKTEIDSYGPATDCFVLNGDDYQSPFKIYQFSNYWLGDPTNDMRDMFPSSTKRGRGYLVSGTTTQRRENKFLVQELTEIDLAEAIAFDSTPTLPSAGFLDTMFVDGCQISIIVLRYMIWDAGANARVPVVGYTDTTSSFACQSGNCLDSNFVSRLPAPRNAANEVWLESVITMTKTNSQWSAPAVTKHPGTLVCPITVDNTPRQNYYEQSTLGIPYAKFPDFVVVARNIPSAYTPEVTTLTGAFTATFFRLDTTSAGVPPADQCTNVEQMHSRIVLEAIKQSNL